MKYTNENDERFDRREPGRAASRAAIERALHGRELGTRRDREELVAESRAFRGTWTGPRLTEAEIEDLISAVNPRDMSGWPLVRLDDRGDYEERRP